MDTSTKQYFLDRVAAYCARTGMNENVLCVNAMGSIAASTWMKKFREDKGSVSSINKVDEWMEAHPDGINQTFEPAEPLHGSSE